MEKRDRGISDILSTLTIAVLFLVILVLVVFSASSYQHGTSYQSDNDNTRAVLSYVITAVKDKNNEDIEPVDYGGAPGIVIRDSRNGFEQRIYMKDGKLYEEYVRADIPIDPETAIEIGDVGSFEASFVSDGLLEIKTDIGTSYVNTIKD